MKRIFICSAYAANPIENIKRAKRFCRYVMAHGHSCFAPHLFYPQFLDDASATERQMGLTAGLAWLEKSDEIWVFEEHPSPGMKIEISHARAHKIPVIEKWQEMSNFTP